MSTLLQDLRFGLRMLARNPGFTAVAVLTLALGIGANTAIFSVVNAVVLRPLPYEDPDRLVVLRESISDSQSAQGLIPVSAPDCLEFARQNHVFEAIAGFQNLSLELSGTGQPERMTAARVSPSLFPLLGIEPHIGRTFTAEEDQPGNLVAVISYGLWQRHFSGDPDVTGKTVQLDRSPYTIVGVMPRSFVFPSQGIAYAQPADLWVPIAFTPEELANIGDNFNIGVVARLKPGVTIEEANADVKTIANQIQQTYPPQTRDVFKLSAFVIPLHDEVVGKFEILMALLLGAVGLVLLIACVNVANLLLVRATDRQKEVAIRLALGAGPMRLVRQFISESLTLGLLGGSLGVLFANWGISLLVSLAPGDIPRLEATSLDARVLLFALGLSVVTSLVFGVAPAFAASRSELNETLREGGRTSSGRSHGRLRAVLVVSEIALALVLLAGAGLLVRSFVRVRATDPGFQPDRVLTMYIALPRAAYSKAPQIRSFYRNLLDDIASLPGVRSVGFSTDLPMSSGWTKIFTPEGYQSGVESPLNFCEHSLVYGDYFRGMGIPLIRGRYFTGQDNPNSSQAVIISQSIADRYWPGQDPIGRRLKWGPPSSTNPWLTVVGVVGDVKTGALDQPTGHHTYESLAQAHDNLVVLQASFNLAVRTVNSPHSVVSALRGKVARMDKQLAIADIQIMSAVIDRSLASRRFNLFVLAVFAVTAMLLAATGIYGVMSYSVAQRTHEIGIRMALGARAGDVLKFVVGHGLKLTVLGVAIGLALAFGLTRFLSSMLYEVRPTDPLTYVVVAGILTAVAAMACYFPARRATKVDPMVALRHE